VPVPAPAGTPQARRERKAVAEDAKPGPGAVPPGRKPRKFERKRLELPVTIVDQDQRTAAGIQFDTADLSLGGAFLRSAVLFEMDEELTLELALGGDKTARVRAKVVRLSYDDPPGMGIAFTRLEDRDREAIRGLLTDGEGTAPAAPPNGAGEGGT